MLQVTLTGFVQALSELDLVGHCAVVPTCDCVALHHRGRVYVVMLSDAACKRTIKAGENRHEVLCCLPLLAQALFTCSVPCLQSGYAAWRNVHNCSVQCVDELLASCIPRRPYSCDSSCCVQADLVPCVHMSLSMVSLTACLDRHVCAGQ